MVLQRRTFKTYCATQFIKIFRFLFQNGESNRVPKEAKKIDKEKIIKDIKVSKILLYDNKASVTYIFVLHTGEIKKKER